MFAGLIKYLIAEVLIPLLKDGIFMLVNSYKVRQLRKEQEAKKIKAAENYEKDPNLDNFSKLP